jgi:CRISPR/Cas system CMR-associated protein Cmr5 small subunit
MTLPTLDQKAAQYAQVIVKEAKRKEQQERLDAFVTKALAVLQEQGVYACMLFLYSRSETEKSKARIVREQLRAILEMLKDEYKLLLEDEKGKIIAVPESAKEDDTAENVLKFYAEVVPRDLDTLLLVRDLYEQMLIYARYAAKAEEKGG